MNYFSEVSRKMMKAVLPIFVMVCIAHVAFSQSASLPQIERFVTSVNLSVNSSRDLDSLAQLIRTQYPDSLTRVKAAYVWVAKNITYNHGEGDDRHTAIHIDSVLKYKSTICAGYVNVFCLLCEKTGITAREIDGYGKTGTQSFAGEPFSVNHAWAAVWLNGQWNLTDVTWGSGYTLEGTKQYISQTNDWYFFTDPETFILDHYPKQPAWQLLTDTVTWNTFTSYPTICLGARENEISRCQPAQSVIRTAAGRLVQFAFTSRKDLQGIVLTSKQRGFQEKGMLQKKNDTYYYTYKIPASGQYDLQIDLNNYDLFKPGVYSSLVDFVYFIDAGEGRTK